MIARFLKPAQELEEAAEFYESQGDGLGERFGQEVQRCIAIICEQPMTWPIIHPGIRRYLIKGFPYGIVYAVEGSEAIVVAIADLRRKPKYWLRRVTNQNVGL